MYCDDVKLLLPKYANNTGYAMNSYTIHEPNVDVKVKDVVWINGNFQYFDNTIVKDMSGFFRMADASEVFMKDCDGIFLVQGEYKKYLFLCELKSTFDSSDIYHASMQIISSFLKMNIILNLLSVYNINDLEVKGFIFSRPADKIYLRDLYKKSLTNDMLGEESLFVLYLCYNKEQKLIIKPKDCLLLKNIPLGSNALFDSIEFHHVDVPEPQSNITMDVNNYIK